MLRIAESHVQGHVAGMVGLGFQPKPVCHTVSL